MFVKLNTNSFIRIYNNQGYIVNQDTRKESVFDEIGADFLKNIDRQYKNIDTILENLGKEYGSDDLLDIKIDFIEFIKELEKDKYLSIAYHKVDNTINLKKELTCNNFEFKQQLTRVHIELTKRCNERCVHCYIPENEKTNGEFVSFNCAVEFINQVERTGALWINFTGGEPFLHPQITEILSYAREKDLIITISSNVIVLSEYLLTVLKKINPQVIEVSLYSLREEIHDKITNVKGSHKKTVDNIFRLKQNNINVEINCPIMKYNYNEYDLLKQWGTEHDINIKFEINLSAQYDFNSHNLENGIEERDLDNFLLSNNLLDKAVNENDKTKYLNEPPCSVGQNILYISSNGLVYPCSSFHSLVLGNLKESNLIDIWNNSPVLKSVRDIKRKDFFNSKNKDYFNYIAICMARNANFNKGDFLELDANSIKIAKHIKKLNT